MGIQFFILAFFPGAIFASPWKLETAIGYKLIPGTFYYQEDARKYANGTQTSGSTEQGIEDSKLEFKTFRFSFMRFDRLWHIGFETGFDASINKDKNSWYAPPTANFTGEIRMLKWNVDPGTSVGLIGNNYEASLIRNVNAYAIPFLFKVGFLIINREKIKAGVTAGYGPYFLFQTQTITGINTFTQASGSTSVGDKNIDSTNKSFNDMRAISEIKPTISFHLKETFDLILGGEVGYVPPTSHATVNIQRSLAQSSFEEYAFGGKTYGGWLGARFSF